MRGWGTDYSREDIEQAINVALEKGVNFFDTAEVYGRGASEELLGKVVRERGEDLVLATKVSPWNLSESALRTSLDRSLRRLGTNCVDLYQIHFPPSYYTSLKKCLQVLEGFVRDGKVKYLGVSNFPKSLLAEARSCLSREDIVSNQVEYSLLCRWAEEDLLPYCRREGIALIAYSPLAQGVLTGKYHTGILPTDGVRKHNKLFQPKNFQKVEKLLAVLREIAAKRRVTPAQVALNWLLCQGAIPIPGAKKPTQVLENAGACGWRLNDSELSVIQGGAEESGIRGGGNEIRYMSLIRLFPDSLLKAILA
jgi:aryl-alcohol dehydrogenase-like predicted oxidoreductase